MIQEIPRKATSGVLMLVVLLVATGADIAWLAAGIRDGGVLSIVGSALLLPVLIFLLAGLFMVNPNEARVLQLFGRYVGTAGDQGLRWANPLYSKQRISLRVRNFETDRSKVNDADGNPIEIAAVVV